MQPTGCIVVSVYWYFPFDRVCSSVSLLWWSWLQKQNMSEIVYSFYPSCTIILAILGTSSAAAEVTLNGIFIYYNFPWVIEIKKNVLGGACGTYGRPGCIQGFGVETWGKKTTWKTEVRLEDIIKMDPQVVVWGGMDLIDLAQDR